MRMYVSVIWLKEHVPKIIKRKHLIEQNNW